MQIFIYYVDLYELVALLGQNGRIWQFHMVQLINLINNMCQTFPLIIYHVPHSNRWKRVFYK